MPVKQRHTAARVYERLVAECGFTGSYSSVQRWVKRWRQEHRMESDGFAELEWAPGSAQVDFGQARAVVAGVERVVRFLAVSFPYSNMRWVVALPGETSECVCQGLLEVFERTGMAPGVVVFDNATGVGRHHADGTAARIRLFSLFCARYGFEPRFRYPYSGHEKGNVENAVDFRGVQPDGADAIGRELPGAGPGVARRVRTRLRVGPLPARRSGAGVVRSGEGPHATFAWRPVRPVRLEECEGRQDRHRRHRREPVSGRPEMAFDAFAGRVRVFEIELRDPDGGHIVTLERVWGKSAETQVDPASLLAIIARKPRIWGESPIRNDFPGSVRSLLDRMDGRVRANLLDDIRAVAAGCGFAATVKAVETVIDAGRTIDRAAIATCAKRILEGRTAEGGQGLKRYDKYMEETE